MAGDVSPVAMFALEVRQPKAGKTKHSFQNYADQLGYTVGMRSQQSASIVIGCVDLQERVMPLLFGLTGNHQETHPLMFQVGSTLDWRFQASGEVDEKVRQTNNISASP